MDDNTIFERANQCINLSLIERYFGVDNARFDQHRNEYFTLSPLRPDGNVKNGTFSINVETGLYNDLSTKDSGNFIQLVSKAFNISLAEAAKKIIEDSGQFADEKPVATQPQKKKKEKKPKAIIPIPSKAQPELEKIVTSKYNIDLHGTAKKIYVYRTIDNESVLCVCRYEKEIDEKTEKEHIPYYYTSEGWRAGRPEIQKYPLYNEHKLKNNTLPILIVEGEKCANVEIEGYLLLSWLGGVNSVGKSDWEILHNYAGKNKIIIWPDNDDPGKEAAIQIKSLLPEAEILNIKDKPKKWDIADAEEEGLNIIKFIENCPRLIEKAIPVTPYQTFVQIINELYGSDNLEQFDGLYYYYDENKHFWEERLQLNIESDLQKWIENNQIYFLDEMEKAIHTFISNTASFLKRYSTRYYKGNPFKDSCLQPYIHVRNGAIEITDNGFLFHDRKKKPESFFKSLYPMHCLDFDFDMKYYEDKNLQKNAPAFYHYIKTLVPDEPANEYKEEMELTQEFFSQVIAYTLNPIKRRPHFFAMYGSQDSGKSFFVDLLETIIGGQFFLTRKIKDMDNRFAAADLWGSKIYLDDDVRANITLPDDFIKFYSGQKLITIEKKNKDAIKGVRISVAMFFISNHAFTVAGGTEGLERRLVYIPYKKRLKNPDVFFLDKIIGQKEKGEESGKFAGKKFDERPAIIGFALRGIKLLMQNGYNFIMPKWIAEEREQWLISSNTVTQFLNEEIFAEEPQQYRAKDLYDRYKEWCKEEDRKAYGKNKFYEMLKLDPHIEFKHNFNGDFFSVRTEEEKKDWDIKDIPF